MVNKLHKDAPKERRRRVSRELVQEDRLTGGHGMSNTISSASAGDLLVHKCVPAPGVVPGA